MLLLALKHHALNNNNNISQRNLVEWKYQVAEKGNIQVKYQYLKFILKYST